MARACYMLLVVRTIIWSSNFILLRGCPDMCNLLDGLVGLGCIMLRDVKGMGQQMGYRSLEWNWPKGAMKTYNNNNNKATHL